MSSWFTSWIPTLPSISLPTSIQSRFISFALKRSLGHLLKPGQLDAQQIDSQLGSGSVQITELELDPNAINSMLTGLPVQLQRGSVSSISAQLSTLNPLSANIRGTVRSLHLHLSLVSPSIVVPDPSTILAQSVASVAETFLHQELSPGEEADLRESFHPGMPGAPPPPVLPGGMDALFDERAPPDPEGVTVLTSLVETLLSRIQFDAFDTRVTLEHPGHTCFTVEIPTMKYHTQARADPGSGSSTIRDVRTFTVDNLKVRARSLRPPKRNIQGSPFAMTHSSPQSPAASRTYNVPEDDSPIRMSSPESPLASDSDMDDDTAMMMSQSIVGLPPRPPSPAMSAASSMYQSAIGESMAYQLPEDASRSSTPSPPQVPPASDDETILSFALDPIVIELTRIFPVPSEDWVTPAPGAPSPRVVASGPQPAGISPIPIPPDNLKLRLSISAGVIACALRADHVSDMLGLVDTFSAAPQTASAAPTSGAQSSLPRGLEASLRIRGIVLLLMPTTPMPGGEGTDNFFAKPLLPPRWRHGFTRAHLDTLTATLSTTSPTNSSKRLTSTSPGLDATFTLKDLSIFGFWMDPDESPEEGPVASPILISDHHLPTQHTSPHRFPDRPPPPDRPTDAPQTALPVPQYPVMPSYEVVDWTAARTRSIRLAQWRTKAPQPAHRQRAVEMSSSPLSPGIDDNADAEAPLLSVKAHLMGLAAEDQDDISIKAAPLRVFLDLDLIIGTKSDLLSFLNEIADSRAVAAQPPSLPVARESNDDDEYAPPSPVTTPRMRPVGVRDVEWERQEERRRLEQLVLDDLELGYDYRQTAKSQPQASSPGATRRTVRKRRKPQSGPRVDVVLPAARIEIRCPPPPGRPPRSGVLSLDIHGLRIETGVPLRPSSRQDTRFVEPDDPKLGSNLEREDMHQLASLDLQRLCLGMGLVGERSASVILSVGSSSDLVENVRHSISPPVHRPPPWLCISRPANPTHASGDAAPKLVAELEVPSLYACLTKPMTDGLQMWADDATQVVERAFSGDGQTEKANSRDASLIGSRFFAKTKGPGSRSTSTSTSLNPDGPAAPQGETVLKVTLNEAALRVLLPRSEATGPIVRPFDVFASDIDALVELRPDGKDRTVLTLGLMDLAIYNTSPSGMSLAFLHLMPRDLTTVAKPLLKLRFASFVVPETTAKESAVSVTLTGFLINAFPDVQWSTDLGIFLKAPPGTFEAVVPSERTKVSIKLVDVHVRALGNSHPGAAIAYIGELALATDLVGDSPETNVHVTLPSLSLLVIDEQASAVSGGALTSPRGSSTGTAQWKAASYASFADVADLEIRVQQNKTTQGAKVKVSLQDMDLRLHLCADMATALGALISDITATARGDSDKPRPAPVKKAPTRLTEQLPLQRDMIASLDEHAFRGRVAEVGPAPDMIEDDLPTNLDYIDDHFSATAGLREWSDDDLEDEDPDAPKIRGETIRLLDPDGIHIIEHYYDTLPPDSTNAGSAFGDVSLSIQLQNCNATLFLYDGYDWARTRKTIEDEKKAMKRRLEKIRQLLASGQTYDPNMEETSTLLFNSVYIGLEQDVEALEPGALIAAIDEKLNDDFDTASQSSWQSLKPSPAPKPGVAEPRVRSKSLKRSRGPSIEVRLLGIIAEVDQYLPGQDLVSRTLVTVHDLEILDHIKTSTWNKFLTELHTDLRGNIRETDSNMVRLELRTVRPAPGHPSEEARLRLKVLPLRLHVDQDALDFLKKFFAFKDPHAAPSTDEPAEETYFQHAEVFPVDIKLDYKPRRVDYRALREGRTIELMNFFHFDGAEMTLRHITLAGVQGWARVGDLLNDLWTPDVKATQLADVISGVAPIRSVVNVGSGVADLVLLPIAQYRKDGRVLRGVQKGATAFVRSAGMEALRLGARLATGTQVILEQAEGVLGGRPSFTTETLQVLPGAGHDFMEVGQGTGDEAEEGQDMISRYADQPQDVREGIQSAYQSLRRNVNSAAQTILAVPMEVYERAGNEGPVRSVVRAVPIAVLRPMIGATEAVSKTLMGIQNTIDPNIKVENEAKYKQR